MTPDSLRLFAADLDEAYRPRIGLGEWLASDPTLSRGIEEAIVDRAVITCPVSTERCLGRAYRLLKERYGILG